MLLRQLFDNTSCTFTYLIADGPGGQALLIDPVLEKLETYLRLFDELELTLAYAIDTHVHADHISALGKLREFTGCETVHGERSLARGISRKVGDGDWLHLQQVKLQAIYTPGHTDDSYCFRLPAKPADLLFTGDTLLIRGTGRTDFQQGDAEAQYRSLMDRVLCFDDDTVVYPGHDYRGMTSSTIGEERRHNPRLQVSDQREYAQLMGALKLDRPEHMDIAVPANLNGGLLREAG
ncbi:Glyoxylase, beta-lactamase superfamily II [Microbulbifer donghaiensis]|uniref:Glyoxylase, beta-lactamase superfamily II n=1 Tax=Microbulbifer donghaiensis TaxID=494016 RepID=A0A1M5CSJ6_9GAMM|nr:MBL fold metallo-hydrolase [Microbulbifer donghaiensis]SHF57680.1 Glyoxylase, beta-lactamase superfamily II [Microbulbifer donghaiensis]